MTFRGGYTPPQERNLMTDTAAAAEPTDTTIKRFLCRHIHTSGRRCGSPALRGEPFCYHHHTTRRPQSSNLEP
jgi:hypothetical protein